MSQMHDPEAAHETLRLIDLRQEQILEDLDRLNDQVEALILLNTAQRDEETVASTQTIQSAPKSTDPQTSTDQNSSTGQSKSIGEAA